MEYRGGIIFAITRTKYCQYQEAPLKAKKNTKLREGKGRRWAVVGLTYVDEAREGGNGVKAGLDLGSKNPLATFTSCAGPSVILYTLKLMRGRLLPPPPTLSVPLNLSLSILYTASLRFVHLYAASCFIISSFCSMPLPSTAPHCTILCTVAIPKDATVSCFVFLTAHLLPCIVSESDMSRTGGHGDDVQTITEWLCVR